MTTYHFQVYIKAKGRSPGKAYRNLRRKLLALDDWADTDLAYEEVDEGELWVEEDVIQKARKNFNRSDDARRLCQDPQCDHGVIIDHIPVCMMTEQELRKLASKANRLTGRLQSLGELTGE